FCLATMFNGALAFGAFFLPGFMWRFSLVPCSGGWSWKPDSLGFHWRTAAFNLQLRLGHCPGRQCIAIGLGIAGRGRQFVVSDRGWR
ncbi:hypothetical protein, partial [Burkholderia contaminans]|uniref:hypothetical protein n=1 Tax=Burkholderia contaminans TaxID=488447 RepID=UPI001FC836A0